MAGKQVEQVKRVAAKQVQQVKRARPTAETAAKATARATARATASATAKATAKATEKAKTVARAAAPRSARRKPPTPSLPIRGIGLAAGGVVLGLGVGLALERAIVGHDRKREDSEAEERFGRLRGTRETITSHDGTRLCIEELGAGPCIVFSHGFSLTGDAWHYQRRDLPESFRCVFFDQRGHGRSGHPREDDYSLAAFAGDLRRVIDWTGEDRVVVVAHSMAGMAALQMAALHPEEFHRRVAGMVLVDSTYTDALKGMTASLTSRGAAQLQRAAITASFRFIGHDPIRANQLRRRGSDLGYLGTRLFGFGSNPSPSQVAFTDRLLAGTDVEVWAKVFPSLVNFDLSEGLEQLETPTLIMVGDKDRLTPPAQAMHMASQIRESRLVVLEDAGHMAFLEEHEVVDAEITAFVRQVLRPTPRRRGLGGVTRRAR